MPQIVGLPCAICSDRISAAFESAFCEKCGNAVHNRCRAPGTPTTQTCSVCGTDLATSARLAEERERQRLEEEAKRPPPPPLEIERYYHYYQIARWLLGAVVAIMIGIRVMSLDEPGATAAGIGAMAASIIMGLVGVYLARRK